MSSLINSLLAKRADNISPMILDIGAYHGDYTEKLLMAFPDLTAHLFEPATDNYQFLSERYNNNSNIKIHPLALSNKVGKSTFYNCKASATNSLLLPATDVTNSTQVEVDTVDNFIESLPTEQKVSLIKVDTQGNDHLVLDGAINTINYHRPIIQTECIFIPLYERQGTIFDLFEFMKEQSYLPVGFHDTHTTQQGALAFCDIIFCPDEMLNQEVSNEDGFICVDSAYLNEQNQLLQRACDERLELITKLNAIAEERMSIIDQLVSK